jgi:hypothetical protein
MKTGRLNTSHSVPSERNGTWLGDLHKTLADEAVRQGPSLSPLSFRPR